MEDSSQRPLGKITVHGDGLGAPSPEQVEARAREIALIAGREPNDFTDDDWDRARRELGGEALPPPPEESEQAARMEEEWEITPDDHGHRVNRTGAGNEEETVGEQLVTDGVEEAIHDQMLEARREEREQEGGIV
ncbi:MAG TPA: DUF2934 domain-containing protein [Chthoniobacterales bacterium]|jgi:hypothetical protein